MEKLGIVLATYNEAANLRQLVERLEGLTLPLGLRIFVVDDSSPDGTSDVAAGLASLYGNISLLTRPAKMGLGSAIREGMSAALADGCDYVLTMDADLSHDPQDVPRLLEALTGGADVAQASRYAQGGGIVGMGRRRRLMSGLANSLCRWLLGTPREATTNFRVYRRDCTRLIVEEGRGRDFEFQPESTLIAMKHSRRIVEVPIIFAGRAEGDSKLGLAQSLRWGIFFLGALFTYRLRRGRADVRRDSGHQDGGP